MADYTDEIKTFLLKMYKLRLSTTASTAIVEYHDGGYKDLILKYAPITTVTAVYDTVGASTVTSTAYAYYPEEGFVYYDSGEKWAEDRRKWKVTYKAGYVTVPADIDMAITLWDSHLNENPDGAQSLRIGDYSKGWGVTADSMPVNVKALLAPYMRRTSF